MSRRSRVIAGVREAILQPEDIPGKVERSRPEAIDSYETPSQVEYSSIHEYFRTSAGNEFKVEFRGSLDVGYAVEFRRLPRSPFRGLQKEKLGEVFANVVSVVKDFVAKYDPPKLVFAGSTDKHTAIYEKLLERLFPEKWDRKMGGFEVFLDDDSSRVAVFQDIPEEFPEWESSKGGISRLKTVFQTSDGASYKIFFDDQDNGVWYVTFKAIGRRSEKSYEVLQRVASILQAFVREHNPRSVEFGGATYAHDRVYRRLLQRLLPGSQWEEDDGEFFLRFPNE